jgi:ABC-type multidrug transport system permease subunit
MFRALLAKDLRRAWRNPVPWLINLALPLLITALIGLVFGRQADTGLGKIRFAVVDEDNSVLTGMLRGSLNQSEGGKYLEPVFLDRATALRQINENILSAALIIPTNFTSNYLTGREGVKLELVKNPAQSIHPTVLEELAGVIVTALNALARNFQSEFPEWRAAFAGEFDYRKVVTALEHTGLKFETAKKYISPPLVVYEKDPGAKDEPAQSPGNAALGGAHLLAASNAPPAGVVNAHPGTPAKKPKSGPASGMFAYLLLGMSAMFLLFLAGNALSDLLRELRFRTFERYQTMRQHLLPFVLSKIVFAVVLLLFSSAVMLGGGGLIFRIQWQQPGPLIALVLAYACFSTALMAVFVAMMPDERRAGALSNIVGMLLAMAGGCMFPRQQLPKFLGEHVTPLLPSAWFVDAARELQFGGNSLWRGALLKFALVSVVLIAGAVVVFTRRFRRGARV